jgi:hypothetical protein
MSEPVSKRFYTTMALGEKRHVTPEGFVVCLDVPMARTGEMLYGPEETPVHSADGVSGVTIRRDADEVFRPDTILSIIGKSVTNDHPDENVTPATFRQLEVGTVISARRGEGVMGDLLLGDIIIKEPNAIQDVLNGKVEVSCGYDADYEELKPGVGRQKNIFYNHLALVDKGRCGPRCAIGDYQPEEIIEMRKPNHKTLAARIRGLMAGGASVKDADIEKAIEEETNDDVSVDPGVSGMGEVHIHMGGGPGGGMNHSADDLPVVPGATAAPAAAAAAPAPMDPAMEARFQGLEVAIKQLGAALQKMLGEEEGEGDPSEQEMQAETPDNIPPELAKGAKDSAYFQDSFRETMALAEIIAPGVRVPTFDSAAKPGKTIDMLCKFRRTVLDLAYGQPVTRGMIDEISGGKRLDFKDAKCVTCDKIRDTFRSLGLMRRLANNDAGERRVAGTGGAVASTSSIQTIADLNKRNRERHERKATA